MNQLVDKHFSTSEFFIEQRVGVNWHLVTKPIYMHQQCTPPPSPTPPRPTQTPLHNELEIAKAMVQRQRAQLIESQKRVLECQQLATFYQRSEYESRKLVEYYKNIAINTKQSENDVDALLKKVKDCTLISLTKATILTDESQKKSAMKQLKFQLHPDKHPDDLSWLFTEMFKIVNV
jgi:hypothetical protein